MIPSISDRLDSIIHAMERVVAPAIATSEGLAIEQAQLVIGHLHIIREQVDHAFTFELLELMATAKMARELVHAMSGAERLDGERQNLDDAVKKVEADYALTARLAAVRQITEDLNSRICDLVHAAAGNSDDFQENLTAIVLSHGKIMSRFHRSWFSGMRFEANDVALPSIKSMLEEFKLYLK